MKSSKEKEMIERGTEKEYKNDRDTSFSRRYTNEPNRIASMEADRPANPPPTTMIVF